jgi:hypothetical protein
MPEILRNEKKLLEQLKSHPGHILISQDGRRLYGITEDIHGNENVLALEADDKKFTEMTEDEINDFIITKLRVN